MELPDRRRRQHDRDRLRAGRHAVPRVLAGGNALAATKHGDNLWLFSLDGTIGRRRRGRQPRARAPGHAGQAPNEPTNEGEGDAAAGQQVWAANCAGCHGLAGTGANGGPDLTKIEAATDATKVRAQITNGGGGMPAFKDTLSEQQIADATAYVVEKITKK